jgi:quercetin dioxygenase-like cupin family protein
MSEQSLISDFARQKILSLGEETRFASHGVVSRTVLATPDVRVILFGFAANQGLSEHTSARHALVHILSGECDFFLTGEPHHLKTGDLLYMPPNLRHAVKATGQFSMLLTLFNSVANMPEKLLPADCSQPLKSVPK